MRRVLRLIAREYKMTVRTKGFVIGLVVMPIVMSGSLIAIGLIGDRTDTTDRKVAIVDRTGVVADKLIELGEERNAQMVYDTTTGKKVRPAYLFEIVSPDTENASAQRLELSDLVRNGRYYAFIEVGPSVLNPGGDSAGSVIAYHAKNAAMDRIPGWLSSPLNNYLRKLRLNAAGLNDSVANEAMQWINIDRLGLVDVDPTTGGVTVAKRSSELEAIGIPAAFVLLMFIMIMFGVSPLLNSVMEEKSQRIAEVLLGSVTPFELMMGKVLGGLAVAVTVSVVYTIVALLAAVNMGFMDVLPLGVLPWFFAYMILAVFMFGAFSSTLGALCSDPKDAQNLMFPSMLPVMLPMFVMIPVATAPLAGYATWLSFIPPFTPTLMLVRLATPTPIPAWQPWVGLVGVLLCAIAIVWISGR
ncbi:MAG: ABC transporter permease, partial [Candidatus Zixiibacteriota bacterium]